MVLSKKYYNGLRVLVALVTVIAEDSEDGEYVSKDVLPVIQSICPTIMVSSENKRISERYHSIFVSHYCYSLSLIGVVTVLL